MRSKRSSEKMEERGREKMEEGQRGRRKERKGNIIPSSREG